MPGMPPAVESTNTSATKHLQCTEVWGGNHFVDNSVEMPGLELRIYSRPHDGGDGGGDVHYVSTCAAGQVSRLVVADVCGHGADVSQVASLLRTLIRRYVMFHDQRRLVRSINRKFVSLTAVGCFATAVVGTFDAANHHLSVSNAGHPPPLCFRSGVETWEYLARPDAPQDELSDLPLGIETLVRYGEASTRLDPGDLLLFYTDALPEAHTADGGMLGQDGLLELVKTVSAASPPQQMVAELLQRIETLSPGNLARDDVTILLVRANGNHPYGGLVNRMLAPARAIGSVVGSYMGR